MKDRLTPIAVVVFVLLLCGYVGSYYALVFPTWPILYNGRDVSIEANYRAGGQFAETIFLPMNQIDRKLRPGTWQFFHLDLDIPTAPATP